MSIRFEKPGMLTTVQDLGRPRFARFGINRNGVMDGAATRLINTLLGNDENAAVLEMHFPAPHIVFEKDCIFAIGGADFGSQLNSEPIGNWRAVTAKKGDDLRFAVKNSGTRAYLAVKGGILADTWLGSASTNMIAGVGGHNGCKIEAGDRIEFLEQTSAKKPPTSVVSFSLIPYYSRFPTVRVIRGAEFDLLSDAAKDLLIDHDFTITSRSDRMGFRLAGGPIMLDSAYEFISSAVTFGTIQLMPDGQLIVLMADQQTSGGYPRVAHVITRDLPLMAQLGPNDKVAFHPVTIEQAEALAAEFERELNLFNVGCRLLGNAAS